MSLELTIRVPCLEWPRFSAVIILLLSSGFTYIASYFSKWLPGSDGRFGKTASPPASKRHQSEPLEDLTLAFR